MMLPGEVTAQERAGQLAPRLDPAPKTRVGAPVAAAALLNDFVRAGSCPGVEVVTLDSEGSAKDAEVVWLSFMSEPGRREVRRRNLHQVLDGILSSDHLRWLHTDSVGVNYLPLDQLAQRSVVVTNGGDNFARPMAEWVVLSLLYRAKRLGATQRLSDAGRWERRRDQEELAGMRVLFLGLGSFSRIAAEMLVPFQVEARAWVRRPRQNLPTGISELLYGDAWRRVLGETDVLVIGVPLTSATEGLVDGTALRALPRGAWVVNLARGRIVDERALVAALDDGHLGGAVLDTFVEEPLPDGHPLWGRENVLVVPHATNVSQRTRDRATARFLELLDRYLKPEAFEDDDLVDLTAGY